MTNEQLEKEWQERVEIKAKAAKAASPKAKPAKAAKAASPKAKPAKAAKAASPKAKPAKAANVLTGMGDFLAGVKGKSLGTGGLSDVGRKSNALKKLYGALARRGWSLKGTSMARKGSVVSPAKGNDFGVTLKHGSKTHTLTLGKGCVLEVDTIVGDTTKATGGRVAAWW